MFDDSRLSEADAAPTSAAPDNLHGLGRLVWRRKTWLVLGVLLGLGVSAGLAYLLPPAFQSTAQILVVKKRPDAVTGVDTRQLGEDYVTPAAELLKSSLIIDRAIKAKDLAALSMFADEDQDLTEAIRKQLTVTPVKAPLGQSNVFKLSFRGADKTETAAVLAAILDSFKDFIDKKHLTVSSDTVELILNAKEALQTELAAKEEAYRQFRAQSPLLGKGRDGLDLRQERLNSIQAKRSTLLLRRVEVESQLTAVELALKEGRGGEAVLAMLVEFCSKSEGAEPGREKQLTFQEQLLPLLIEERKLLEAYGSKHPEVVAVRQKIEGARQLLALPWAAWNSKGDGKSKTIDPIDWHLQLLKQKVQLLKTSEEQLAKLFQTEHEDTRRLAAFEIQDETYRTSIALSKQMYEALVKRLSEVSLGRNAGGYQVDALEPPSVGRKVSPSLRLLLLLGGCAGLTLGLALAYVADARSSSQQPARRPVFRAPRWLRLPGNGAGH